MIYQLDEYEPISDLIDIDLAKRAIHAANDGITVVDLTKPDQPLIFVNKAFVELTGYQRDEVLGKNCRFLQGPNRDQPLLREIRLAIKNYKPCRALLKNFKKDGTLFWNELSLAPIADASGNPNYYVGIQKDVTRQIQQRERIIYLSEHDDLTGVFNYRGFFRRIPVLIESAIKQDKYICIGMADIDHFKEINDHYGHIKANNILKIIGSVLIQKFSKDDAIARFGGDEFCFAMIVDEKDSQSFYKKINNTLRSVNSTLSNSLRITMSAGMAIEKVTLDTKIDHLIHLADSNMYDNKQGAHFLDSKKP